MEPANIDWKSVNSIYIEDELYEHINAPKFIDFMSPDDPVDDEAWFCRPDCKHPKTAEDFRRSYLHSKAMFIRALSSSISEPLLLGDRNCRDSYLKRRLHNDQRPPESHGDCENQNPNLSTPPPRNPLKEVFKSNAEKKKCNKQQLRTSPADSSQERPNPQLKTTLSASNLFSGKEILSQITELCGELKKLATRATEKEGREKSYEEDTILVKEKTTLFQELIANGCSVDLNNKVDDGEGISLFAEKENEKESKPLLAEKVNFESPTSNGKQKLRREKKYEDTENIPMSLDLKKIVGGSSLQVRTNPPSPQCFSATRGPLRSTKAITSLKTIKSMPAERGILQEVEQNNRVATNDDQLRGEEKVCNKNISLAKSTTSGGTEEARSLDIFWFLKPCTMSS